MLPSMSTSPAMYDSTIDISFGGRSMRRRAAGRLSTSVNGACAPRSTAPSQNFTSNERWLGSPNSASNTARHRDTASSSTRAADDCSSTCAVDMIRKLRSVIISCTPHATRWSATGRIAWNAQFPERGTGVTVSSSRHRYHDATVRYGAHFAPIFFTRSGVGNLRKRYALWIPF